MSRVLSGTPPRVTNQARADLSLAYEWIEQHFDELRGQWVAVSIKEPKLIARAPTLKELWKAAPSDALKDCLIHYVSTVEEESQPQGTFW